MDLDLGRKVLMHRSTVERQIELYWDFLCLWFDFLIFGCNVSIFACRIGKLLTVLFFVMGIAVRVWVYGYEDSCEEDEQ